jgi:hypothetical protein
MGSAKRILFNLLIILAGGLAAAAFAGVMSLAFTPADRADLQILMIALMGFFGAVVASTMTTRAICYSMLTGSIIGAMVAYPDINRKSPMSLLALGKIALGAAAGFVVGSCWTIRARIKSDTTT